MISRKKRRILAGFVFILCIVGGIASAQSLIGKEGRLVDALQLFFSGMGGGATFVAALSKRI